MVMLGVIAELDEEEARVRVDADGLLTGWIPWGEQRAGPGVVTWSPPEVGEQVVIACPYGDPAQAVVLCSVYQQQHDAPATAKTIHRTRYADGTVIEYDRATHRFAILAGSGSVVVECQTATVRASESVTLDTPKTIAKGDLKVEGKIDADGDITTPQEVKAGDIGLQSHHHIAQGSTAPTTPAKK